jgi:hypothetical protein
MIERRQLGLFLGKDAFSLVETNRNQIVQTIHVPLSTSLDEEPAQGVPEDLHLTALLQRTLREHKLTFKKINLSLAVSDLIYRSFTIPAMQPNEVRSVVEFEITKYVPIKLENLVYAYHPAPLVESGQKKLRILFVAIRKDTLSRYHEILEHSGLQVEYIEPASVSLVRILNKQGKLARNQTQAIIEISGQKGKVIILEQDIVQFVREFFFPEDTSNEDLLSSKLLNELRVSLNYYSRQNPMGKLSKIVTLTLKPMPGLTKALSEEFGMPVSCLLGSEILKSTPVADLGLLSAAGMALREKEFSTKDFDLSERAKRLNLSKEEGRSEFLHYQVMAGVVATCAIVIFLTWKMTNKLVSKQQALLKVLEEKAGVFRSSEVSQIDELTQELKNKLTNYKDIRIKSNIAHYLHKIPALLPQGMWLKTFHVAYYDTPLKEDRLTRNVSRVSLVLDGYAYLKNANEQFRLVNLLVSVLKKESDLASSFDNIDLVTVQQESLQNHAVTYFKIVCK